MDFGSALRYLDGFVSYEAVRDFACNEKFFDLDKLRGFLKEYGVDYTKLKCIHVAGSKGKGSVSTICANYLYKAGYKVGLFTSPHILDIRERIWLNGEIISKKGFASYVEDVKNFIAKTGLKDLTYFEILTVIALKFFVDKGVDYAVMEVGLGGRLDSTNIINPVISVLSTVELEHTEILGDTLEKILNEKLGIVRENAPVLIGYQSDEGLKIIKKKLKNHKKIYFVGESNFQALNGANKRNVNVAWSALRVLFGDIDEKIFREVVNNFYLIGRFDVRKINGKTVVFDMAHTENSINNLIESLTFRFPHKEFVFIVSVMKGKNVEAILKNILKISKKIYLTSSNKIRGYLSEELYEIAKNLKNTDLENISDPISCYKKALKILKSDQILVITGSHFLLEILMVA